MSLFGDPPAEQSRDLIWTGFQIDLDNDDATRQEIVIASCEIMLDPSINVAIARSYQAEAPKAAQAQNETERKKVAAVAEQADNMAEAKLSAPEAIAHLAARTAPLMHYGSGEGESCSDGEYIDCSVFGVSDRYVLMDSRLRLASLQLATPHAITSGAMYLDVCLERDRYHRDRACRLGQRPAFKPRRQWPHSLFDSRPGDGQCLLRMVWTLHLDLGANGRRRPELRYRLPDISAARHHVGMEVGS